MAWRLNLARKFAGTLVALATLGVAAANAQGKLEQTDVAIVATRDTQVGVQLAIADALGYFKDEGLRVSPKWVQSGDDVVQLLGSAAVPIGCASTFGATLLAARHLPVHAVQGLADMSGTQGFVLAPNVKLASPRELEGKKLAYTNGNPQVLILAKLAKKYGFDLGKVTLVNMQPSEGLVAADKGEVAGLLSFEPFLYRLVALGGTKYATGRLSWVSGQQQDDRLLYINAVLMVQDDWIKNKPNTVRAVMRAFDRATKFLASDRPKAVAIVQSGLRIDSAAVAAMMNLNSYNSALTPDIASSITDLSDWALSIKRIPVPVKPTDVIDTTLLKQANPRLVTWHGQ